MLIKLNFHPSFIKYTNTDSHIFDVNKLSEIKDALSVLFPKMRAYIRQVMNGMLQENMGLITENKKLVSKSDYMADKIRNEEYTLVPIIAGAGGKMGGIFMAILGIALIATGIGAAAGAFTLGGAITGAGLSATAFGVTAGQLIMAGLSLALSGLSAALLSPQTPDKGKTNDAKSRTNGLFSGIQNTTNTDTPVPIAYGMPRLAGHVVSAHLESINHGPTDNINVIDGLLGNYYEYDDTELDLLYVSRQAPIPIEIPEPPPPPHPPGWWEP